MPSPNPANQNASLTAVSCQSTTSCTALGVGASLRVLATAEAVWALRYPLTHELFALAVRLGGSVSGEHGVGWVKRGALEAQWHPRAVDLHEAIKRAFDPKGLLNPGKKVGRAG